MIFINPKRVHQERLIVFMEAFRLVTVYNVLLFTTPSKNTTEWTVRDIEMSGVMMRARELMMAELTVGGIGGYAINVRRGIRVRRHYQTSTPTRM